MLGWRKPGWPSRRRLLWPPENSAEGSLSPQLRRLNEGPSSAPSLLQPAGGSLDGSDECPLRPPHPERGENSRRASGAVGPPVATSISPQLM